MFRDALLFVTSVLGIGEAIRQVDRVPLQRCTANQRSTIQVDRVFREVLDVRRLGIVGARQMVHGVVLQPEEEGKFCVAETTRSSKHCVQNRLQLIG